MGKKKGISQRSKTKPSSSRKAAELFAKSKTGFVGFSGGVPSATSGSDPHLELQFKHLQKKDSMTKLRAISELKEIVPQKSASELAEYLTVWRQVYNRNTLDNDRRVREGINAVHLLFATGVKKKLATQLKALMAAWLCSQCDCEAEVSAQAKASFQDVFPTKKSEALKFCADVTFANFEDNLKQTPKTLATRFKVGDVEARDMKDRLVSSTLLATCIYLDTLTDEENATLDAHYRRIFTPALWKLVNSEAAIIRGAMYSLISSVVCSYPQIVEEDLQEMTKRIFGLLAENEPRIHKQLWRCLLTFTSSFPDCWKLIDLRKAVISLSPPPSHTRTPVTLRH